MPPAITLSRNSRLKSIALVIAVGLVSRRS